MPHVVEVAEYVPLAKDSTNPKPQVEWSTQEADRVLLNTKAKLFIKSALCREEYDRIMECKIAKEIWETLQTHHEGTNSVKETRIDIGVRKFELFEMKEEETIDQMYGRFTSIINELNSLGKSYTTHERIRKILRCLPKTWRPIVTAITVAKDLTKVSLEDLIGSLKAHESIIQEDKPKKKMIALETQSGECSQKNETLREDEELLQEDDQEELAFLSRRIKRLLKRRNQLKKNFQPKRNGTKPEVDMSKIQCYGCNQFGHYKNDCPKNKRKKPFFKKKSMMHTWDDLEEAQSEDEEQEANVCLMTHSNSEEETLDPCSSCQKTEHLFDNLLYDTQILNQKNVKLRDEITILTKERDEYKKESSLKSEVIKGMQTAHTELSKRFEIHRKDQKECSQECLLAVKRRPWYLDSGCSRHMTVDRNSFLSFETREAGSVTFGNNEKASIKDQPIVHTTDDEEDESIIAQNHDSDENPTSQGPPKTWRVVGYHPPDQIIGKTEDGVRTRKALQDVENKLGLISQIEPRSINEAIIDESWIEAMKEELHQFEKNEVWNLVPFPKDHSIIGTRWVFRNKLDENGKVVGNKGRLVAQGYNQQEGIDYDETFAPIASVFEMSMMGELGFFLGLQIKQQEDGIFISQEKYVNDLLKKYKMNEAKIMSTPMHPSTSLDKDEKGKDVSEKEFQTSPKESHLIAVKRIFRYLVGTPDVGLWYKKGSHFDLQAYCDADYAGDKVERKRTSGACQFLGEALVSWCCRKQNTIALSTTEAEYVAASNCCTQVIWIKNQLEDFSLRSTQMARTKNAGGRKVPRTKNPPVSSSPPRSPSPPKPPTPKSSSSSSYETASESQKYVSEREATPEIQSTPITTNMQTTVENPPNSPTTVFQISPSKSPENSPIHLTQNQPQIPSSVESQQQSQNPTNEEDSPFPTATIPSPKDSPPVLVKIKKSKSFDSSKIRRSSRIMSGAGKKHLVDTTVHVLDQSNSKTDLLEKEIDDFELEPVTSTKFEPAKAKKTPTPKKKEVETVVKAPRTKKKINLKKSKEKLLPSPLIQPEDEEIFDKYWKTKPVAVSRINCVPSTGPSILHHMIHAATSGFKKIALPYAMILTRVFRLYYADMDNTPFENHDYTFSLKNVSHMKKEAESPVADVGVKRKREVFEKSNLNVLADASGDHLENVLQTDGNTQISGDDNPTTESEKLATTAATTLQGFKPMPVPRNTTMFPPLMTSSQGSLSSFCTSEFIRNILTSNTPEISTMPIPNPTDSTLPSIPSPFATFDSFCSSVNAANAGTKQLVFEGNVNFDFPGPARPTKHSRIETDMEQMKKDLDNVIKGMTVQHSMMDHLILESKTLRTWFTSVVWPQLHLPPPPEIETPHFDPFPA
ncbi:hypothetical protein TSUD_407350 [Trifolium subterraneum]|uniref:CCHC-type domain-containing protein n=1 Tax=Trifolium subterraneum TaxID=3900 RepID=A0A2Z6P4F1_TRISU|nr:hypothetical protein TSUD_407350 [Trifolium subterraneum]